jgi:anti-anti-sigma factor
MTVAISNPMGHSMNGTVTPISERTGPASAETQQTSEKTEQAELAELVPGREQELLARLAPVVQRQNVTLDLGGVQRIDAAGIGVLLALYASARTAGRCFTVSNPTPRVAEILELVGVNRILLSRNMERESYFAPFRQRPVA